jgi:hypothetical protein
MERGFDGIGSGGESMTTAIRQTLARPLAALAVSACAMSAHAATIGGFNVIDTLQFIDTRQAFGATPASTLDSYFVDLTPVGSQPPTAVDGTTVTASRGGAPLDINYLFSPALPNRFFGAVPFNPADSGAVTLQLTNPGVNGGAPATITVPSIAGTPLPPFANSIALVNGGTTPSFSWNVPAGFPAGQQTLLIFDDVNRTPQGTPTIILQRALAAGARSFGVPAGILADSGHYTVSVQESIGTINNTIALSRAFANFAPLPATFAGSVFLPNVGGVVAGPGLGVPFVYSFGVVAGVPVEIDPTITNGYLYQIGAGDPLFASVTLPDIGDPDGYSICTFTGGVADCSHHVNADETFTFVGGTDKFEVVGIDPGLDTRSTTGFVTTLTFASDGVFTGSQTPLTDVTEPPAAVALLSALVALGFARRRLGRQPGNGHQRRPLLESRFFPDALAD